MTVPGRYRVLHGGSGRLGGGIGAAERECHEDGQATLRQERRGVATAGSVHWRALPRQLWMCDALHRLVIHLRRAVCTPPYRLEITMSPSCSRAFTGSAYGSAADTAFPSPSLQPIGRASCGARVGLYG